MSKDKQKTDSIEVKTIPDYKGSEGFDRVYANYMIVSHDEFGFVLTFCDTHFESYAKKEDLKKVNGEYVLEAPIVSQIIIPANLIPKIIKALETNYKKYYKENEQKK